MAWAGETVGQVSRVSGEASVLRGSQTLTLQIGSEIEALDRLMTGENTRLELVMADDTKLTLGADAELVIDAFVYQPEENHGSAILDVIAGAFRFTTGKISGMTDKSVTVKTGFANLAVRGTDFWGGPIDESHGVLVLDGEVEVANEAGSVTLTRGLGTMVSSRDVAPEAVKLWPESKIARAIAAVTF
jgi:hypothetical protein